MKTLTLRENQSVITWRSGKPKNSGSYLVHTNFGIHQAEYCEVSRQFDAMQGNLSYHQGSSSDHGYIIFYEWALMPKGSAKGLARLCGCQTCEEYKQGKYKDDE